MTATESPGISQLLNQYNTGPIHFAGTDSGLYERHLLCCFGGEESAGASFLRFDGSVWTTDKDGPIMDLLAAEITARTGTDPGQHYRNEAHLSAIVTEAQAIVNNAMNSPEGRA